MDAAHGAGLIHRDVKPANILVAPVGRSGTEHAYLSDFGLVKHTISRSGITRTGQFVGTLDYVSPEQVQGNPVDHRADIYSFGCVLYEILTGRVPYPREGDAAVMWAHVRDEPPSILEHQPSLPPALDRVVAKAMAKEPDDRYQSAEDLVTEGRAALSAGAAPTVEKAAAMSASDPAIAAPPPPFITPGETVAETRPGVAAAPEPLPSDPGVPTVAATRTSTRTRSHPCGIRRRRDRADRTPRHQRSARTARWWA